MILNMPFLFTTLHFAQIFRTLDLTFIALPYFALRTILPRVRS